MLEKYKDNAELANKAKGLMIDLNLGVSRDYLNAFDALCFLLFPEFDIAKNNYKEYRSDLFKLCKNNAIKTYAEYFGATNTIVELSDSVAVQKSDNLVLEIREFGKVKNLSEIKKCYSKILNFYNKSNKF
jgi:hypothetical protein